MSVLDCSSLKSIASCSANIASSHAAFICAACSSMVAHSITGVGSCIQSQNISAVVSHNALLA